MLLETSYICLTLDIKFGKLCKLMISGHYAEFVMVGVDFSVSFIGVSPPYDYRLV